MIKSYNKTYQQNIVLSVRVRWVLTWTFTDTGYFGWEGGENGEDNEEEGKNRDKDVW